MKKEVILILLLASFVFANEIFTEYTPSEKEIFTTAGQTTEFKITLNTTYQNKELEIKWYVDDILKQSEKTTFSYLAEEGIHKISTKITYNQTTEEIIWALKGEEQAEPTTAIPETTPEEIFQPTCGNNIIEQGENCENCPADIICPEEYECKNGKCIKEVKSNNFLLILFASLGFILFTALVLFFYYYSTKKKLFSKEKKKEKPSKRESTSQTKKTEKQVKSITKNIPETKPLEKPTSKITQPVKKPKPKKNLKESVAISLIKSYIQKNKGKPLRVIRNNLLSAGWKEEQIRKAEKLAK